MSYTLFWVTIAGAVLYLPNIGLFYGVNEWLGVSARTFAFIDTTISAPLGQLSMVPCWCSSRSTAPRGAEATMFAIMASLMNLALSASELVHALPQRAFGVTQQDYSSLGPADDLRGGDRPAPARSPCRSCGASEAESATPC